MPIRVLVADDDQVIRVGIIGMLAGSEIEVICQAANCDEAVRFTLMSHPEVVLLDLRMPDGDGFQVLESIKRQRPDIQVLILSVWDGLVEMAQARGLKADGYLSKACTRDDLLRAIRRAAAGKTAWSRPQLRRTCRISQLEPHVAVRDGASLTAREREVLAKLTEGMVNEEIADELGIDLETVKQHVKSILKKLGVEDRTQAAVWAVRDEISHRGALERS